MKSLKSEKKEYDKWFKNIDVRIVKGPITDIKGSSSKLEQVGDELATDQSSNYRQRLILGPTMIMNSNLDYELISN